jgi:hypothetical protein
MSETQTPHSGPSHIPAHVAAQAARAEELMRLQREGPRQEPEQNPQEGQDQDEGQGDQQPQEQDQGGQEQPQQRAQEPQGEDWEERYKRENGRARQLAGEVRTLGEEVASLRRLIGTMQSAPPAAPTPSPQVQQVTQRLITEDEEKDYGSDFLNVVGKKAQEVVGPIVSKYEQEIENLKRQLEGVNGAVQTNAQDRFFNKLAQLVPTWQDLDTNQEFIDWLAKLDPYSGRTRQDMLNEHYSKNDAARVAAFFQGFLDETAAVTAPRGGQPSQGGRAQVPAKAPLEAFAAPGRAKSTTAPANAGAEDKPIITRAQIAKFYADVTAGKFRGKDDEKKKFENQIFEAERENRIR